MVILLKLLSGFMALLPLSAALALGRFFGWLIGDVLRIRRAVVMDALTRSCPDKDPADLAQIASRMYRNLCMTVVEMLRISVKGLPDLEGRVTVHGGDKLEEAAANNQPVLLLMAHAGNWEMVGYTTVVTQRSASVVVKELKEAAAQDWLEKSRKKMNLNVLYHRNSFRECLRQLKENGTLAIILDQNRSKEQGVFVDYFGRPAWTSPGLAIISSQTKVPVIPAFSRRRNNREHDLFYLPPIAPPADRSPETLRLKTEEYTKAIEAFVRDNPDQWLWVHKRWKTQPGEAGGH